MAHPNTNPEPKWDMIINEGQDRMVYPGTLPIEMVGKEIPSYRGGVTMTIVVSSFEDISNESPLLIDPEVHGGVPCVGQGKIPIAHILRSLASGISPDALVQNYQGLTIMDIQLALETASWVIRDPAIDWQALNLQGMIDFQKELDIWQSLSSTNIKDFEDDVED